MDQTEIPMGILTHLLAETGFAQDDLRVYLGVSHQVIRDVMEGRQTISPLRSERVATLLGLSLEQLQLVIGGIDAICDDVDLTAGQKVRHPTIGRMKLLVVEANKVTAQDAETDRIMKNFPHLVFADVDVAAVIEGLKIKAGTRPKQIKDRGGRPVRHDPFTTPASEASRLALEKAIRNRCIGGPDDTVALGRQQKSTELQARPVERGEITARLKELRMTQARLAQAVGLSRDQLRLRLRKTITGDLAHAIRKALDLDLSPTEQPASAGPEQANPETIQKAVNTSALSQKEIANRVGISPDQLARRMHGKSLTTVGFAEQIIAVAAAGPEPDDDVGQRGAEFRELVQMAAISQEILAGRMGLSKHQISSRMNGHARTSPAELEAAREVIANLDPSETAQAEAPKVDPNELRDLVEVSGLTRPEFATRIGLTKSKLERRINAGTAIQPEEIEKARALVAALDSGNQALHPNICISSRILQIAIDEDGRDKEQFAADLGIDGDHLETLLKSRDDLPRDIAHRLYSMMSDDIHALLSGGPVGEAVPTQATRKHASAA